MKAVQVSFTYTPRPSDYAKPRPDTIEEMAEIDQKNFNVGALSLSDFFTGHDTDPKVTFTVVEVSE